MILLILLFPVFLRGESSSLNHFQSLRGEYRQVKILKKMDIKLTSQGYFKIEKEYFLWIQTSPIKVRYEIKKGKLVQQIGGRGEEVIGTNEGFLFPFLLSLMRCHFKKTFKCLKRKFNVKVQNISSKDKIESIEIEDEGKVFGGFVKKIVLTNKKGVIDSLKILEKSGNSTFIQFENLQRVR